MAEAVASQLSPGAGRFRDWLWPDSNKLDGGPDNLVYARQAGTNAPGGAANVTGFGGGAGAIQLGATNGIECASIPSNNTGGGTGMRWDGCMNSHIKTSRNAIPAANDDERVYRVYCNMAPSFVPNPGRDMGFYMAEAGNGSGTPNQSTSQGWGFAYIDAQTVNFIAFGPNGLQSTRVFTGDILQWHSYEMRITGASATADATLQVRIDGIVVPIPTAFGSWAAGTNLPASLVRNGRCGFRVSLVSWDSKQNWLQVSALRFMAAQSMLGVL